MKARVSYLGLVILSASFLGWGAQAEVLPDRINLKTETRSFTRREEFAIAGGRLWSKPAGSDATAWELVDLDGLPPGVVGESLASVKADGDSLMVVLEDGHLYDAEIGHDARERVVLK